MIRLGVALPHGESRHRRALLDDGRLAEDLGYERLWLPEAWTVPVPPHRARVSTVKATLTALAPRSL